MPYKSIDNLPEPVRHSLPIHAQHVFREAFNASFAKYGEIRAFKISWAAVKKKYKKQGDKWVAKGIVKRKVKKKKAKRK
jgi:cation transport regulator